MPARGDSQAEALVSSSAQSGLVHTRVALPRYEGCKHLSIHVCIFIYMNIYVYLYTSSLFVYLICLCVYIYVYVRIHIYVYIHIHVRNVFKWSEKFKAGTE